MENWVKAEEHWNWASEPEPGQPRDWSSTGTRNVGATEKNHCVYFIARVKIDEFLEKNFTKDGLCHIANSDVAHLFHVKKFHEDNIAKLKAALPPDVNGYSYIIVTSSTSNKSNFTYSLTEEKYRSIWPKHISNICIPMAFCEIMKDAKAHEFLNLLYSDFDNLARGPARLILGADARMLSQADLKNLGVVFQKSGYMEVSKIEPAWKDHEGRDCGRVRTDYQSTNKTFQHLNLFTFKSTGDQRFAKITAHNWSEIYIPTKHLDVQPLSMASSETHMRKIISGHEGDLNYLKSLLGITKEKLKTEKNKQATNSTQTITKKEITTMATSKINAKEVMDQNKAAMVTAAKIEIGNVAVKQAVKVVKSQMPIMVKGYMDLPVAEIIVANLVVMGIKQFAPDNEKAAIVADAMLIAAMQTQLKDFNIQKMVDDFVNGIDLSALGKLGE